MSVTRNIVNGDDLNLHLQKLKNILDNPLYHEFVDKNVKNFFLKQGFLKEAPEGFIATFPGPYHHLTFKEMPKIQKVCETVILQILKKQLKSSIEITQVQIAKLIEPELELYASTESYDFYKILTSQMVSEVGKTLHNCLKGRVIKSGESYYVLKRKTDGSDAIVIFMEGDYLVEARANFDSLPSLEDFEEISKAFKGKVMGRILSSGKVIARTLVLCSLISIGTSLTHTAGFVSTMVLLFCVAFCFFYCMMANLHSRDLVRSLRFLKIERFFREKL